MRIFPRNPQVSRRTVIAAWVVVGALFLALLVWLVVTVASQSDQIRETQAVNTAQDSALAEANRRLTEAGEPPVPTPEPGPAGEPGQVGPVGPVGPPGPQGVRGPVAARGLQGIRGAAGDDGADGATGAQGPKGETGPQGPAGPAGTDGADGQDGTDGTDGTDGADPWPFTFTFTVPSDIPGQDGHTYIVTCHVDGCTVSESDSAQG